MLYEQSREINALETFITEVERQLGRKVKIIRSVRGGEYYGIYDENGQHPGPFSKFHEKHDICTQYNAGNTTTK